MRKSRAAKIHHSKTFTEARYAADRERSMTHSQKKTESVEDFLKRGGQIKKYAYKNPPKWKATFNGHSKYDKR